MPKYNRRSRVNKFDKRRKTTRAISVLLILGLTLAIVFFSIILFGGNDDDSIKKTDKPSTSQEVDTDKSAGEDDKGSDADNTTEETKPSDEGKEDTEDTEDTVVIEDEVEVDVEDEIEIIKEISSDPNVIEAYSGNWQPHVTKQAGEHTTDYADGSMDRIEIKEAVIYVTDLNENEIVELWVGNGGDQKVITTVSNSAKTEIYRVYLSWIHNEGWKPTMVEKLKEDDTIYN